MHKIYPFFNSNLFKKKWILFTNFETVIFRTLVKEIWSFIYMAVWRFSGNSYIWVWKSVPINIHVFPGLKSLPQWAQRLRANSVDPDQTDLGRHCLPFCLHCSTLMISTASFSSVKILFLFLAYIPHQLRTEQNHDVVGGKIFSKCS